MAALAANAASAGQEPLTLSQAIKLAAQHSSNVQVAQKSYDAAKARIGEQASRGLPQILLSGSATQFDNKTTVNLPGAGSFEVAPDHQETLSIALTQDFDIAGQIRTAVSQAKLEALSARYQLQGATDDQALETTVRYYQVLRAEEDVRVASAALDAYKEQLGTATKLYSGGVGQKIDVDRAESQVANAESDLIQRKNDLDSALSTLNDLIGKPLDEPTQLAQPASQEAPPADDRPKLIAQALDRRPEALAASVQVAAAEKGIKLAQASTSPSVTLSLAGYDYPTTSFQYPRSNVGALTLSLNIPIFDGGLARERTREAHSLADIAKTQKSQTYRDISLEVQNAALAVGTAKKRLDAANVSLKSAQAARDLADKRYQVQVGLYLEVTDAQSALTSAQSAQVDATYNLLIAQARLERAISNPIVG